jgi:acyl-CoA synthetase (AMP-forming)/AMP-acid ligase II
VGATERRNFGTWGSVVNLMMLLEMATQVAGDRVAFGTADDGLTYQQLFDRAGGAARTLQEDGAGTLAFVGTATDAFPTAVFAASWAGIPLAPLNYRLSDEQLAALLERLDRPLVVADPDLVDRLEGLGADVRPTDEWIAAAEAAEPAEPWAMDPSATALLLFTSGTTAAPKAAVLRQEHLCSYVLGSVEFMSADEDAAALVSVPPYHIAGVANVVSNTYSTRRVVLLPQFEPDAWLAAARDEAVTHALVVPTMLARVVDHLDGVEAGLPALRSLAYGGAPMPVTVLEKALTAFGETDFVNAYGLTETSSTIAVLGPEDHRTALSSDDPAVRARLGSAGRLLPTVEAEIRDGLLWVRGEQVSGEYEGLGSVLDDDGWFPTADLAHIDDEGYLFIEGRADDTIIRGGENIAPAEIEDVLRRHAAVSDCAVVGIPDDEWGQRIAAVVVAEGATPDELQAWCREHLRGAKTPDLVELRAELPYTDTGKLLRRTLRAELSSD